MSLSIDDTSTGTAVANSNTVTWSHTCAGSERLLIVGTAARDTLDTPVSGVTYNGVAMTFIRRDRFVSAVDLATELWFLIAPATGANDIVVTYSFAVLMDFAAGGAISLNGAHQSSPTDADNGGNGTGVTTSSHDVTTVADGAWVIDMILSTFDTGLTPGAGQTEFAAQENVGEFGQSVSMSYEGPKTPAGEVTMSWTWGANSAFAHSSASFEPTSFSPFPPKLGGRVFVMD